MNTFLEELPNNYGPKGNTFKPYQENKIINFLNENKVPIGLFIIGLMIA